MKGHKMLVRGLLVLVCLAASVTTDVTVANAGTIYRAPQLKKAPAAAVGQVFQGTLRCCKTLVVGPQSNPTTIVQTPLLEPGTYLIRAVVSAVLGPSDNLVCAASPLTVTNNDGVFGVAGNGSSTSGTGPNGVYGSAVIVDTWTVSAPGDRISVGCNVGNYGQGSYVSGATIVAERIGHLTSISS